MTDPARNRIPERDWTAVWESAAAAAMVLQVDNRAYAGPAWEIPAPAPAVPSRAWKMAVLERKPSGGAEHWGHLLLVVGDTPSGVEFRSERGIQGSPGPRDVETLPSPAGSRWQVRLRPRSRETAPMLRAFALEFQRQAALLVSGDAVLEPGP